MTRSKAIKNLEQTTDRLQWKPIRMLLCGAILPGLTELCDAMSALFLSQPDPLPREVDDAANKVRQYYNTGRAPLDLEFEIDAILTHIGK